MCISVANISAWRCVGVGACLINALLEFARAEGYLRIFLSTVTVNIRAIKFYVKHGFVVERETELAYPLLDGSVMQAQLTFLDTKLN